MAGDYRGCRGTVRHRSGTRGEVATVIAADEHDTVAVHQIGIDTGVDSRHQIERLRPGGIADVRSCEVLSTPYRSSGFTRSTRRPAAAIAIVPNPSPRCQIRRTPVDMHH